MRKKIISYFYAAYLKKRYIYIHNSTYRTVSSALPSKRIVHEMFDDPPRPNINTLDGDLNIPRDAAFDLRIKQIDEFI